MNAEKISVIVPVYNAENFVQNCVNSLLEQSYRNLEIILVDDGSADRSLSICQSLQKRDSRILLIAKENGGVSSARNCGLDAATGDWIAFVDADDSVERYLFSRLMRERNSYGCEIDAMMFEYRLLYADGKIVEHSHRETPPMISAHDAISYTILPYNRFACTKVFSRSIVGTLRFDSEIQVGEDSLFAVSALKNARSVLYSSYCGYNYFQNTGSATGGGYHERYLTVIPAYEKIRAAVEYDKALYAIADMILHEFKANNVRGIYAARMEQHYPTAKALSKDLRRFFLRTLFGKRVNLKRKARFFIFGFLPRLFCLLHKS
ncbi:MAG: glycosyltransferase [Oscillospiraceae bacterium]|jgi:glycosyltransferase involved in cell wall biosynthesis|nr:glycosyltransferase [Oscillospiraceae bacterium]